MKAPVAIILVALTVAVAAEAVAANRQSSAPRREAAADACRAETESALDATGDSNAPEVRSLRRDIRHTLAVFRLHRPSDARAAVDAAKRRLQRAARLFASDERTNLEGALAMLHGCISSTPPDPMATITIRATYFEDERGGRTISRPAGAGVYIRVEEIPVGRTRQAGTLTAMVPSGDVTVTAIVPPDAWGEQMVRVSPGTAGAVTVVMDDTKEPSDETDLVVKEVHDGVLRADTPSLTLQFLEAQHPMRAETIEEIELLDDEGNTRRYLTDLFLISGTAIVARNARAVLDALPSREAAVIRLRVSVTSRDGFVHHGTVEFRVLSSAR